MIISNIIGGIGNQMFQYAAGKSLSLRTGEDLFLSIDQFGEIKGQTNHNGLELSNTFCLNANIASPLELKKIIGWRRPSLFRRYIAKKYGVIFSGDNFIGEPCFEYWSGFEKLKGNNYLHGYWQSQKYFYEHEDEIRKNFEFKLSLSDSDQDVLDDMRRQPSASIHVRRGDYANKKNSTIYNSLDANYYNKAMKIIEEKIPNVKFYLYSDDFDWANKIIDADKYKIRSVSHNNGAKSACDMLLMAGASHNIIANSTFSWWAAWLNKSNNKIVVAPSEWFCNGINDFDLIPSEWIKV